MKDMAYAVTTDFYDVQTSFEACPVPIFGDNASKTHYEINIINEHDGGYVGLSKEEVENLVTAMSNWLAYTEE